MAGHSVNALAVSGGDVYAAGWFGIAGETLANSVAKWDGRGWSALGSGMNNPVWALAVSGNDLYAGGDLTMAGAKSANHIARAYLPTLPTLSLLSSRTNVMVSWPSTNTADFTLEQSGPLANPATWVPNSSSIDDDGTNKSVTLPATNSPQFFRLRRP